MEEILSGNDTGQDSIFEKDFHKDATFTGIELTDVTVRDKEFYRCRFEKCNLSRVYFMDCRFEDCAFDNCDLSLMKPNRSEFIDVKFSDSKLIGINWTEAKSPLRFSFNRCKLNDSVFFGLELRSTVIENCTANRADFEAADLSKSKCCNTDFQESRFKDTNLSSADFSGARNYNIDPNFNRIKKAVFSIPEVLTLLQSFDIIIR